MDIEQQVCSLELAKKLKELGVKQDSLFCYVSDYDLEFLPSNMRNNHICIAAFTVAELGKMLPWRITHNNGNEYCIKIDVDLHIYYENNSADDYHEIYSPEDNDNDSEADSRAKMLSYLIESKYMEPPK